MKKHNKKSFKEKENISEEKMVEIQAEAYYRAIKRIQSEKYNLEVEEKDNKKKYKWYDNVLFFLNVCIFPWRINKRFDINKRVYDSVLVAFVSVIMQLIGGIAWLVGIVSFIFTIYKALNINGWQGMIMSCVICFAVTILGALVVLAGKEFEKETNSEKIYAYSASILALISCIISVVSLIKE